METSSPLPFSPEGGHIFIPDLSTHARAPDVSLYIADRDISSHRLDTPVELRSLDGYVPAVGSEANGPIQPGELDVAPQRLALDLTRHTVYRDRSTLRVEYDVELLRHHDLHSDVAGFRAPSRVVGLDLETLRALVEIDLEPVRVPAFEPHDDPDEILVPIPLR